MRDAPARALRARAPALAATLAGALAALACLGAPIAAADDTEVFFARPAANGSRDANVMFMFDISGSMQERDGTPYQRITRLKQAMLELFERTEDVNVGIGAFNGYLNGGAILYPATDLDADACPSGSCETIRVAARVRDPGDDVMQHASGYMEPHNDRLAMVEPEPAAAQRVSRTFELGSGADDAVEHGDGGVDVTTPALSFFHVNGQAGATSVGVRFPDVNLPDGARVLDARIVFRTRANANAGEQSAEIRIDKKNNSPEFGASGNRTVSGRDLSDIAVRWPKIPSHGEADREVKTPDIAGLVEERIGKSSWTSGEALTFLFTPGDPKTANALFRRGFKSFEDGSPPKLELSYTMEPAAARKLGLRFAGLDVPRGARITDASLEFITAGLDSLATELEVRAHKIGHAPPFGTANSALDGLPRTSKVNWSVTPWTDWGRPERSADLSGVVQKIVDRSDWCGGNAIALLLEGEGLRHARSRDAGPWDAPVLRVGYEASSADLDDTCVSRSTTARIANAADDATQSVASGEIRLDETVLATTGADGERLVALRFDSLELPANADIGDARLSLTAAGSLDGDVDIKIQGELSGYAPAFVPGSLANVGGRTLTPTSAIWRRVEGTHPGDRIESADLAAVLEEVTSAPGWSSGDPVVLVLRREGGTGRRSFASVDDDVDAAASLSVSYRVTDPGDGTVLRTARDEMRDRVLEFRPQFLTPLVDAYYEAASYMLGRPVHWGKTRGLQSSYERFFRVSHPGTYTGGTLETPDDCEAIDPDAIVCAGEEITGNPVYTAPVAGACQVNQIVLLTDGAATANRSKQLIRDLTGDADCAAQPNGNADCALELASWLNAPPAESTAERVLTHTVGFNLSSDAASTAFLKSVAEAGGGGFHEADSAVQLASVFRTIVDEAADIDTGFTAAAATVDRFNRASNREDVYYAMFRPTTSARWPGNLKRYALGNDVAGRPTVVDRLAKSIFDADGGISPGASSYWGTAADGADVSAGGAANAFTSARTVKTFLYDGDGAPGALVNLHEDTAALSAQVLGVPGAEDAYRTSLLQWSRGIDVLGHEGEGEPTALRNEMGDPMHSTPFLLDYDGATEAERVSIAFVGTNEGYLHAIDTASGAEKWSIVPGDLLGNLHRFFDDEPGLDRPYGLDGEIVGWVEDLDGDLALDPGTAEKAYVVVGMRRGGRNYYAFDVTDPASPALEWVVRGGRGDFADLGQSWSAPVRTRLVVNGDPKSVLIFGGGYDPAHDALETRTRTGTGIGQAIFVVDAATGALVAKLDDDDFADLDYAVPSDLNVVDVDLDGLADLLFVGDMGGQLWRFDFDHAAPAGSRTDGIGVTGGVVADLNGATATGNRRFYHAPDVALVSDGDERFLTVAIGSGWRAHPLDTYVEDRFYVLRDEAIYGPPRDADGAAAYPDLDESDLYDASTSTTASDTTNKSAAGWYVDFSRSGEKVLGRSLTLNGQVFFTSYVPDAENVSECSVSVGGGRLYAMDVLSAAPVLDLDETGDGEDGADELALGDRSRALRTPGIPTPVTVLTQGDDPSSSLFTGDGNADEIDFGASRRRTYWAEQ